MNKNLNEERELAVEQFAKNANTLGLNPSLGTIPVIPKTHYVTAKVIGTTVKFVKSSTDKEVGVQSFDGEQLDANKPFVLCAITGFYAKESTADNKTVATADYSKSAPAGLINGDLLIKVSQQGNVVEMPFGQIINQNTTNNNLDREFQIADMPLIKDKTVFEIEAELPEALASGSDHFVRLELRGYSVRA